MPTGQKRFLVVLCLMATAWALGGCKTAPPEEGPPEVEPAEPPEPTGPHAALMKLFAGADRVSDWQRVGEVAIYGPQAVPAQNMELVEADLGPRSRLVRGYDYVKSGTAVYSRGQEGERLLLRIFQMGGPSEAFGLFSVMSRGTQFPRGLGLRARMAENRLGLAKERYFISLRYSGPSDATPVLREFGDKTSEPVATTGYPPAILQNFPTGSLPGEHYYLHTFDVLKSLPFIPMSDPEDLERKLDLGPNREMAIMGYPTTRTGGVNYLFAIHYPTPADAESAYQQYRSYLDASTNPADKNVAVGLAGQRFLVGTFNAEENSIEDRLSVLIEQLGG